MARRVLVATIQFANPSNLVVSLLVFPSKDTGRDPGISSRSRPALRSTCPSAQLAGVGLAFAVVSGVAGAAAAVVAADALAVL